MNKEPSKEVSQKKTCPACGTSFLCMHNKACWCMDYDLTSEKLVYLLKTYDECLCPACLSQHGVPKNEPGSQPTFN